MRRALFVVVLVAALNVESEAQQAATDITQWRGANRDGVVTGFTAPAAWPEALTQRWKVDIGLGYATPFLGPFRAAARRVVAAMPAQQGVEVWPYEAHNLACLVGERP